MGSRIGKHLVTRLQPDDKPYEYRDSLLKGFLLRVQPSGIMTYYCEYGRGKRLRLGRVGVIEPDEARKEAKRIMLATHLGRDPVEEREKKTTENYGQFLENHYWPYTKVNMASAEANKKRLTFNFSKFFPMQLDEIKVLDVEKWRNKRIDGGTNKTTINRDLTTLKASLNKAVEWGFIEENPIERVRKSKVDNNPKVRYLTREEEAALRGVLDEREGRMCRERDRANQWREKREYPLLPDLKGPAFVDHLKPMILLSINTGLRRGELFHLTWENVDLDCKSITVQAATAKSKRTRHIPLNKEALDILTNWKGMTADPDGLVFQSGMGKAFNNVRNSWANVLADASIKNFRWHDMRHHFASKLVMAGVDLNTVRELLGHSDYQMTLRYAHLAPEHKAAAVEMLN